MTVTLLEPPAVRFSIVGDGSHVPIGGAPEQVIAKVPAKPFEANVRLNMAGCPAVTVAEVVDPIAAPPLKSVPMPLSVIVRGLPLALSVMVMVAERMPGAEGRNVIVIVQLAPAFTLAPQLSVRVKSPAFAPLTVILVIVSVVPPLFVSVTVCAALVVLTTWPLKFTDVAESMTLGGVVPVPLRAAVCGLPGASLATLTDALLLPAVPGPNVTVMVHVPLTASVAGEAGQLLVCAKSPLFVPVIVMLVIVRASVPLFVSVMFCPLLVVPTS